MYLLHLLTKSVLTNNFLLIEIYNFILIYVSFCILIIALSLMGLKKIYYIVDYLGFYIYISNIL